MANASPSGRYWANKNVAEFGSYTGTGSRYDSTNANEAAAKGGEIIHNQRDGSFTGTRKYGTRKHHENEKLHERTTTA